MLAVESLYEVIYVRELLVFMKFESFAVHLAHVLREEGALDVTL